MEKPERLLQDSPQQDPSGALLRLPVRRGQAGLHDLHVPVAVLVPEELVEQRGRVVEPVAGERLVHPPGHGVQPSEDPAVRQVERQLRQARLASLPLSQVRRQEPVRVPDLVAEVPVPLDPLHRQLHIAPLSRQGGQGEPQRVGAEPREAIRVLPRDALQRRRGGAARLGAGQELFQRGAVDDVQRIDDVAPGL